MSKQGSCDIGLIGLAVMGENLALNIASRGYSIAVYNRTTSVTDAFTGGRGKQPNVVGCHTLEDLVAALKAPRKVMMMVKASSRHSSPCSPRATASSTVATRSIPTPSAARKRLRRRACTTSAPASPVARRVRSKARA
jgi:6-phosphogluconate dehydrogenase